MGGKLPRVPYTKDPSGSGGGGGELGCVVCSPPYGRVRTRDGAPSLEPGSLYGQRPLFSLLSGRGLYEGGTCGGSVPGCFSAPRLPEGTRRNGVQPAGVQWGVAESRALLLM